MSHGRELSLTHRVVRPRAQAAALGPQSAPGLLLVHGRGADEMDLLGLAGALDPRLVVISVRAPYPLGPGYHWYEFLDLGRPEPTTYTTAQAALGRFVDEAITAHGLDATHLYGLGFSQGAVMIGGLALRQPSPLAGAVLLSGYLPLAAGLPVAPSTLAGLPVFVGHGTRDRVIPVAFGRRTRDDLTRLGADLTYREYPLEHAIGPEELAAVAAWLTARLEAPLAGPPERPA